MRTLSRVIENPVTGEVVTFLTTTDESGGEFVAARVELPPGASGPQLHQHIAYTETFRVLEGDLDVCIGGKDGHRVLPAGQTAHVPLRTLHRFWNGSDAKTVFSFEIRPACNFEKALRAAFGLARDGRTTRVGIPTNVWELCLIFGLAESYLPGLPIFLQRGIFGFLAGIAIRLGYPPDFPQYTRA